MIEFNISTPDGIKQAIYTLQSYGANIDQMASPVQWMISVANAIASSSETRQKEIEAQKQLAIEIIQVARENHVDELEITISNKAGVAVEGELNQKSQGIASFDAIIGSSGNMTLKVKYKQ